MKRMFFLCAALTALMSPLSAYSSGCIVVRPTSNLLPGLESSHQTKKGSVDFTVTYRYLFSDRHFRGSHEEKNRQLENTDVRNSVHTTDYSVSYWLTEEWRLNAGIPVSVATRSSLYEHDRVSRHSMGTSGIGDMRLMGYRDFMLESGGLTLGLGVKLPTGEEDATDTAYTPNGPETRYVDQSIQLGDGGTGLIAEAQYYRSILSEKNLGFINVSYLFNPKSTNGVPTHRSNPYETVQSVPDSYQVRFGFARIFGNHWSLDTSVRAEGVPAEDVIGDSDGFRRPGYAVYFEPGVNYRARSHRFNLSVPYAVHRDRIKSEADRKTNRHGDAAFADYLIMAGYNYAF